MDGCVMDGCDECYVVHNMCVTPATMALPSSSDRPGYRICMLSSRCRILRRPYNTSIVTSSDKLLCALLSRVIVIHHHTGQRRPANIMRMRHNVARTVWTGV